MKIDTLKLVSTGVPNFRCQVSLRVLVLKIDFLQLKVKAFSQFRGKSMGFEYALANFVALKPSLLTTQAELQIPEIVLDRSR